MRRFCDYIDTVETTERILKDYCRQMHRAEKGDPCALEYFSQLMPAFNHLSEAERFATLTRIRATQERLCKSTGSASRKPTTGLMKRFGI